MTDYHSPQTANEAAEIVRAAADQNNPLLVQGGGTKADIGAPVQASQTLSSRGMTGVTLYEPSELVIAARAGTPLAEIQAVLAEKKQRLNFDPVTYQSLLGLTGTPTIGAIAAANLSGPRRITFGASRDSLIGIEMVNGKGEIIKNGGRVMKNVTGYDLTKLICGSWGTLGLLTEVCFKLQPMPEGERTLVWSGLSDKKAVALLCAAMGSPFEITSSAHIPDHSVSVPAKTEDGAGEAAQTLIRIEGFAASLAYRTEELTDLLADYGEPIILEQEESTNRWQSVAELDALGANAEDLVWKLSLKPSDGPLMGAFLREKLGAQLLYDWSGGLVWAALDRNQAGADGGASIIRSQMAQLGGHATLIRAPHAVRAASDVFQPLKPGIAQLTRAAKLSFDPKGIFNPGRMGA